MNGKGGIEGGTEMARRLLSVFLKANTTVPAKQFLEENDTMSFDLGNILVAVDVSQDLLGAVSYKPLLRRKGTYNLEEKKKAESAVECIEHGNTLSPEDAAVTNRLLCGTCLKPCLLAYFYREIYWMIVSILCSSYLSSLILMRSMAELLVNISTAQKRSGKGNIGMKAKIDAIPFLDLDERASLKTLWDELCAWPHPYGKWVKNICPAYSAHYPSLVHTGIAKSTIGSLHRVIDVYLVICKEHFGMDITTFAKGEGPISISNFPLFGKRIKASFIGISGKPLK